jgi:hypothetical protein
MKICNLLLATTLVLLLNSCKTPSYVPNVINTPLFQKKGQFNAAIHASHSGGNPQLAYAVTDHFGLMLNGSFLDTGSEESFMKQTMVELGGGYFTTLDESGKFEIYAGYGLGKVEGHHEGNLGVFASWYSLVDANVRKYFIQPSLGYTSDHLEICFTTRIVNLRLIDQLENNKFAATFGEPAVTLKAGGDKFKGVLQLGYSINLFTSGADEFHYRPSLFSLGAHFSFN